MSNRWLRSFLTFVAGTAVIAGLPLVAWGLDEVPAFLSNPVRRAFLVAVVCLNAIAAIRNPEIGKKKTAARRVVGRQHVAVVLLQVISIALLLAGGWTDRHAIAAMAEWVRVPGFVLYLAGFILMQLVESYLGSQFTVEVAIQEGQRLLTDGPFRSIRHPRYVGIILFSLGIALVFRSWVACGLTCLVVGVLLWRIRDEEALMREEFGDEWDRYMRSTAKLIPHVY